MAATTEQFILNLAANLAYDLFKAGASRLRKAAIGEVEGMGLRDAYRNAFAAMLGEIPSTIKPEGRDHLASLLQSFVEQPNIAAQLIDLALATEDFAIDEIRAGFFDLGFDVTTLEANFDDLIRSFVKELAVQIAAINGPTWTSNHINLTRFAAIQVLLDQQHRSVHEVFETVKLLEQTLKEIKSQSHNEIRNDLELIRNSIAELPIGLQSLANDTVECLNRNEQNKKTRAHDQALEAYLAAVRSQSEELPYITLPGKPLPLLSTIYIEQIPEEDASLQELYGDNNVGSKTHSKAETIDQAVKRHRHIVIRGGPGVGKSTMLHHLALVLIREWMSTDAASLLPLYLQARNLITSQRSLSESLHQQTAFELGRLLQKPLPNDFFAEPPAPGALWVVMIDGFDEVVSIEARDQLINAIVFHADSHNSNYHFIFASRPVPELDRFPRDIFGHYLVRPFDSHQVTLFAKQWFTNRPARTADDASRFLRQIGNSRIDGLAQIPVVGY